MQRSRAYRASSVKKVKVSTVVEHRDGSPAWVGCDVSKDEVLAVVRWGAGDFERPWRVENPTEVREFVQLLGELGRGRELTVALEPTGTYGDPLRQALSDAGLRVQRVSPKAAHDYAEVFDGVPSQHDGKDAAVVSELAALGKSWEWPYQPRSDDDQELAYWVDWLEANQGTLNNWYGRLESLLARHWPEAGQWVPLNSGTLLRCLQHYGGPARVAADAGASQRLRSWSGSALSEEKLQGLVSSAGATQGVRAGVVEQRRLRDYAEKALYYRGEIAESRRQLRAFSAGNAVLQRQAAAVGVVTACVLWVRLGSPEAYRCGAAYRKAMGLNLKERSSGRWQGRLMISKRGPSQVRRWLYFAVLRLIQHEGIRAWYAQKRAKDQDQAGRALIGVMRKLALALWQVGANAVPFEAWRLFPEGALASQELVEPRRAGESAGAKSVVGQQPNKLEVTM
jgi:transposase